MSSWEEKRVNVLLQGAVMLAVLLLCAPRGADAQHFIIYGLQGFLDNPVPVNGTYKLPCWVQPYYGVIGGGFPLGTYDAGQVYVRQTKNDPCSNASAYATGRFYTPQAVDVPERKTITENGVEVGSFGLWVQPFITSTQGNYGLYFAGSPATYSN